MRMFAVADADADVRCITISDTNVVKIVVKFIELLVDTSV